MKKLVIASLFAMFMAVFGVNAVNPVKWTATADMSGDDGTVVITATVDDGWYIYDTKKVDGVTATKFDFAFAGVEFEGGIKASSAPNKKIEDKTLGTTLYGWTGKVKFERKFTVTDAGKAAIDVTVTYMACNGKNCTAAKTETITVNIK